MGGSGKDGTGNGTDCCPDLRQDHGLRELPEVARLRSEQTARLRWTQETAARNGAANRPREA